MVEMVRSRAVDRLGRSAAVALVVLVVVLTGGSALAASVAPVEVVGNPTCSDLCYGTLETKVDPPADGAYDIKDGYGQVIGSVAVTFSEEGKRLDWSSTIPIVCVFVKGSDSGNQYTYGVGGSTGDTGLYAPANPSGGPAAISHVLFCHCCAPRTGLTIEKAVDWNGVTPDDAQSFVICITGPSYGTPNCKQFSNEKGWSRTWYGLSPGDYTVMEVGPGSEWEVQLPASPVPVVAGYVATAGVTNTHLLGALEVTKAVDWGDAKPDVDKTFEICIAGPSFPTGTEDGACQVADHDGATLLWSDLIPGDYTVTEADPGASWTVTVPPAPVAVPVVETATASVNNAYALGSLEVIKSVEWNGVAPDDAQAFEICVTGASFPTGDCKSFGSADGWTHTWTGLVPGDYVVTETDPGASWTVTVPASAVPVAAGGTAMASVANSHLLGALDVTKTVAWGGQTALDRAFEVCVQGPSYPLGSETGACQLIAYTAATDTATTASWESLVPGDYLVTETDPNTHDNEEGYVWSDPEVAYADGLATAVVVAGGRGSADIFNQTTFATAVKLKDWKVVGGAYSASVSWTTSQEDADTLFRVFRSAGSGQGSATLVVSLNGRGAVSGGYETSYAVTDGGLSAGTYTYWLTEATAAGEARVAGPTKVVVGLASEATAPTVYVPMLLLRR